MMQALVNYSGTPGSVELRDVPKPQIRPGEVLLRSRGIGICGSDLHQWHGTQAWAVNWPVTLGHEFCGEVVEVGSDVTGWHVGDRVACETAARVCGHCPMCRTGHYNLCPERLGFGYGVDGAAAEFVKAEPRLLHRIPDNVTWEQAALTEPCAVAFNAVVEKSHPRPGDLAVVLGPGPIGLLVTQMLRNTGPARLVLVGLRRDAKRLELAQRFGADEVIVRRCPGDRRRRRLGHPAASAADGAPGGPDHQDRLGSGAGWLLAGPLDRQGGHAARLLQSQLGRLGARAQADGCRPP